MRKVIVAGAVTAIATAGSSFVAAPAAQAQSYYVPVSGQLVVYGHGYGHGHGMSQYGAEGAAQLGKSWRQILAFYYPGTKLDRGAKKIRVLLSADTSSDVQVKPAAGLLVRDLSDGKTWTLPTNKGARLWRIAPRPSNRAVSVVQYNNGTKWHRFRTSGRPTFAGSAEFQAKGPIGLVRPGGSVVRYRGALRSAAPYAGATVRDTVNALAMDDYVRGVIADEMPASWSQPALRSQAVAARTYASYMQRLNPKRYYQICDTTSCQVYGGASAEERSTDRAVAKTARKILTYNGRAAFTQFSSSNGGWTSAGSAPYLTAEPDPYDGWAGNPGFAWKTTISVSGLESRYPELGQLQTVRVTQRDGNGEWGGRVQQVVLDGTSGDVAFTGDDMRWMYGLKSNWFTFEPTPIMSAWKRLGGKKSPLGVPEAAERPVANKRGVSGAQQAFAHGKAIWSPKTGARPLYGPILKRYTRIGGVRSPFGFPRSWINETSDGGQKIRFQKGMIFNSKPTGAHELSGKVLAEFKRRHLTGSRLGYPVTKVYQVARGVRARFQGGRITWLPERKKFDVDIRKK